ncbi:hypothetical protein FRC08_008611 [Ceratobasidium sp. 394]|nr:hypothetical protein FRC08_008611 [Ceratobasidium sp. 394]
MSFLDTVLRAAPSGSNPYAFAVEFVAAIVPPKPVWYFKNLIAVGVIAMVHIDYPILETVSSRFEHLLLVLQEAVRIYTLHYLYILITVQSGIPYPTPNALTMFLLWNLVFMSLMQPYIWLNYVAYYSPSLHITSRMYFWYGFIFIWDGVGMWFSAFGTLYATLFPRLFILISSHMLANILLHPLTLNAFCFAPPIILMITQLVTSTFSAIAWSNLIYTRSYLLDVLTTVATQWNTRDHQKLDENLVQRAVTIGNLLLKQKELSRVAFQRNAGACQC